jgi:hypothetical protein
MLLENFDKFYQSTRYHIPENHNFNSQCGEKLKLFSFPFCCLSSFPLFSLFSSIIPLFYFPFLQLSTFIFYLKNNSFLIFLRSYSFLSSLQYFSSLLFCSSLIFILKYFLPRFPSFLLISFSSSIYSSLLFCSSLIIYVYFFILK